MEPIKTQVTARSVRVVTRVAALAGALCILGAPRLAAAESGADEPEPSQPGRVRFATEAGAFLPLVLSPTVGSSRALAAGFGGYDSAEREPRVRSFAEARLFGPVAVRFGAEWRDPNQSMAPSATGRVQLFSQGNHGFDGGFAVAYKAEGFTEPEGELEVVLAAARRFGDFRLLGNIAYGQDPEGEERDGEVRAAALWHIGTLYYLGVDARGRFDLGSEEAKLRAHDEPKYDIDFGPVLNVALGPLALAAHGGLSGVQHLDGPMRFGVVGMAGLGTVL